MRGSPALASKEATAYRAIVARANYLAQDRADIQFSAKCICKAMAKPTEADFERAERLVRYLRGRPRAVQTNPFQAKMDEVVAYGDSNWAGERASMKSTSGAWLLGGEAF